MRIFSLSEDVEQSARFRVVEVPVYLLQLGDAVHDLVWPLIIKISKLSHDWYTPLKRFAPQHAVDIVHNEFEFVQQIKPEQ